MKQLDSPPPIFKTFCVLFLALTCVSGSIYGQQYDPSSNLPAPGASGSNLLGESFTLISRVLTFSPLSANNQFNGMDDVNVNAIHNIPTDPPYEPCYKITSTQNVSPIGLTPGWYVCDYTKDDDGSDLMQFAWTYPSNPMNGVTTYDAVQIQIIAGSNPPRFVNPYANVAADVIKDGVITSSNVPPYQYGDADEVAAFVLGIIPNFSQAPSWKFIPARHLTLNPTFFSEFVANPFTTSAPLTYSSGNYFGTYSVNLSSSNPNDYIPGYLVRIGGAVAVKMGDVNFSNSYASSFAPIPTDRSEVVCANTPSFIRKGSILRVTYSLNDSLQNVVAWQAGLRFDKKNINVFGVEAADLPFSGKNNYNVMDEAGEIRALWIQPQTKEMSLPKGTQLFSVVLELQEDMQEGEALLAWNSNMEKAFYKLDGNKTAGNVKSKVTILSEPMSVSSNPNPFKDFLNIKASGGTVNIPTVFSLFDLNGHKVAQTVLLPEETEIRLQTQDLPTGIYILKATNEQQSLATTLVKL